MAVGVERVLADRFELIEEAASGGMGTVYRARDRQTRQPVAVKIMAGAQGTIGDERFAREVSILAQLSHPAIVRYVAHGVTDRGEPYLVMPYLQGEALDQRLARRGLTVSESLTVARRTAEALAVAHESGVVHRDVKPSNLLLVDGDPAQLVVLDFGVARLPRGSALTATGALIGTVGYMAPEQASGDMDVGPAADVFALGCVLYECLAGEQAFGGGNAVMALAALLLHEPPPLRARRPGVDPKLEALVGHMLEKDPEARPADARAVLRALADVGDAARTSSGPPVGALSRAMTAHERRHVSVVLARDDTAADAATLASHELAASVARLRDRVAALGAKLAPIVAGSYLCTLSSRGSATDQASRAARCALLLCRELPEARVAVATGAADTTGGSTGGPVVERASALLAGALPGAPLVDEPTAALLEGRFGLAAAGGAHKIVGETAEAPVVRTPLGEALPFVGRAKELALLEATLGEAIDDGVVRAAVLMGEAGIGKSRLCLELRRRSTPSARWLTAAADSSSVGVAFDLARKLIRSALGGELDADRLRAHLTQLDAADGCWPALAVLCGLEVPLEPATAALLDDAYAARRAYARAFATWLEASCRRGPLVVLLEDVHWGDPPSLSLLESSAAGLTAAQLLLLATARPLPFIEDTWRPLHAQLLRLPALTPRAAQQLLATSDMTAAEADAMLERARGNPFFLEELLRWRALGRGDEPPATLLAVIQARVDALESEARRVLRAASILEGVFGADDVAALLGGRGEQHDVDAWLATLQERELFDRDGNGYRFSHALLRDACYAMLTPEDEHTGHRLAAEWLATRADVDPARVANHFLRAGLPAEAVAWLVRAATDAMRAGDVHGAAALARRGVEAGAEGEMLGRLLGAEVHALGFIGGDASLLDKALRALELLPRGSREWFTASAGAMFASAAVGREDVAATVALPLLELEEEPEPSGAYGHVTFVLLSSLVLYGQADPARTLIGRIERALSDPHNPVFEMWARGSVAIVMLFIDGDLARALAESEAAHRLVADAGDPYASTLIGITYARCLSEAGVHERACAVAAEAVASAQKLGADHLIAWARAMEGGCLYLANRLDEAEAVLAACQASQSAVMALRDATQAVVSLARNDLAGARAALARARVGSAHLLSYHAALGTVDAQLALADGRPEDALRACGRALEQQAAAGALPRERLTLALVYGRTLAALGRRDDARAQAARLRAQRDALAAPLSEALRASMRERLQISRDIDAFLALHG